MNRIVTLCLPAIFLAWPASSPDKTVPVQTIDLTGDIHRQKQILLGDIATDIRYMKLEVTKECFIKQIESSVITEKLMSRKTNVKYPDKKQKLVEFLKTITDEDNQILTIVTLK